MPNVVRHAEGRRLKRKLQLRRVAHADWTLVYASTQTRVAIGEEVTVDTTAGRVVMKVVGSRAPAGKDAGAVFLEPLAVTEHDGQHHRQYHPQAIGARWIKGGARG